MRMQAFFILFALLCFPFSGIAQTTETETSEELQNTVPTSALVEILTAPHDIIQLPINEPVELDLSFLNIPGGTNDLAQGVVAKGYARSVDVDGQKIGQLVLTGVAKGEKIEALNSAVFTAQFDLKESQLNPDEPVAIMGNGPELIEALKRLQAEPVAEKEEVSEQVVQSESPEGSSDGESGNADASGYQTPDAIEASAEPTETSTITTEGCSIRPDLAQGEAFVQSKTQDFKDGVMTGESACTDSEVSYKIQKSYASCINQDIKDLTAVPPTATAQYMNYYVDGSGTNQEIGECQPDPELVFAIVEKHGSCMIYLDYNLTSPKAVFQSSLIYMNQNNVETQVASCAASVEKPAVPMVQTKQGCSPRPDYSLNKSFSQSVWTYQDNGITYQAGSCVDDGTEYAHVKTYKDDAGDYLCSPINNGATVTLQSRVKVVVDGLSEFITECTPDTNTLAVISTTEGCTNAALWTHDLAATQSYGQERFYFMDGADKQFINETCQTSTATYLHEIETTGWQDHDDQLFAYPLTTVYITAPAGRYNIKTSEVLQGAQQMPYTFQKFDVVSGGTPTYEGCNKLQPYDSVKVWKRPNDTLHNEVTGTASPTTSNACDTIGGIATTDWTLSKTAPSSSCQNTKVCISGCGGQEASYGPPTAVWTTSNSCTYASNVAVTRDDNMVISSNNYEGVESHSGGTSVAYAHCSTTSSAPPTCPSNPSSAKVSEWRAQFGY